MITKEQLLNVLKVALQNAVAIASAIALIVSLTTATAISKVNSKIEKTNKAVIEVRKEISDLRIAITPKKKEVKNPGVKKFNPFDILKILTNKKK